MRIRDKLMRNTAFNYGIRLWGFLITFILMPIIIYYLGITEYGIYLLITAVTGYFGLLDLGISTSLVKFVAEYHAKGDKQRLNEAVNTAFFTFLGIGIAGAIGLFAMGTFFMDLFKIDPALLWKARAITYILAVTFLTGFSLSAFRGVLAGLQRYDVLAYISLATSLVNVAVTIWVLLMGFGIVELVLYTICFGMLGWILTGWYAQKYLPYIKIKLAYMNKSMVRTLFNLSMFVLLLSIFSKIVYYTDIVVIGFFLGTALVTFYTVAWKIYSIPGRVIDATLQAMIPAASELDALQKKKGLQMLFLRVTKYCLALLFLLAIPSIFMSRYILIHWIEWAGGNFSLYYLVANILILSSFFDLFNYVASQILIGMNKIKLFVSLYGVAAIMNLILSIIFVQHIGLEGVALGTTIPFIVLAPIFMWNVLSVLEIDWRDFVKKVLLTNIPYACCVSVVLYLLLIFHIPASLIEIGVYYFISIALYLLLFYFLSLDKEEKGDLKSIFSTFTYHKV